MADPVVAAANRELGERFMDAFTAIENRIRSEAHGSKDSFGVVSREFFARRGLTMHQPAFGEFVELRNTIAHGRHYDGGLLATPAPEVVDQLEALRALVEAPPLATDLLARGGVVTCAPTDGLDDVLPLMADRGFSLVPVYSGATYVGLLTHYAIARWLADGWARRRAVASADIAEVLEFAKPGEDARFVGARATAPLIVAALIGDAATPRAPAVLVTPDGSPRQRPLAIATGGDLPRLVDTLRL